MVRVWLSILNNPTSGKGGLGLFMMRNKIKPPKNIADSINMTNIFFLFLKFILIADIFAYFSVATDWG